MLFGCASENIDVDASDIPNFTGLSSYSGLFFESPFNCISRLDCLESCGTG